MKISHSTLKNGLQTVLVHIPDAPTVTVLVLVAAGSRRETPAEHGLAHFLEHMCFKGTVNRPKAIDISRELEGLGAQNNAFTGKGYTGYYAKAAAKHAHAIVDVIADLYLNPTLPEDEIEREKGVIVEEINMYNDMPRSVAEDLYNTVLFGEKTPAGRTIIGTKESVRSFTRADVARFRSRMYRAGATTVVVAGSFEPAQMRTQITRSFSAVPAGVLPKEKRHSPETTQPPMGIVERASEQTHLIIGVPSYALFDERDESARVLATVLGGGMSSRLFQRIREELGLCYYIYASQDAQTTYGDFSISAGIPHGKEIDTIREIRTITDSVMHTPIPADELMIAKNYLAGNFLMGVESTDDVAFYYGARALNGLPLITPTKRAKAIMEVTEESVRRVAKQLFSGARFRGAIVTPRANQDALTQVLTRVIAK
jgi:predicted Zn-dependent peptidase